MTTGQMVWAAVFRFLRVLAGQAVALLITETAGVTIPVVNLSVGALLNMIAKFLRDKYKWDWLPL